MIKDKKSLENICRLDKTSPFYKEIMKRHKEAVKNSRDFYIDPATGFNVFTSLSLYNRGYCCSSGCRHCPFSYR